MRKTQELSLNMIVVGALALLVLLIIGGVLIFGGGDMLSGLTSLGPSQGEVDTTAFTSTCRSKCNTLNLQVTETQYRGITSYTTNATLINQIKAFCCSSADLDGSGLISSNELCSSAYTQCRLGSLSTATFCQKVISSGGTTSTVYKYTEVGTSTTYPQCSANI
ncbi:Uncharacterised protein [Candidatus Tiddalikarchaeum anstoanum]|nr:Uncharacterised protein [Candidatus Tiddalikarchaeum anstoanum]